MQLAEKVALVTGAGTGIGAAIARRFVAEGARVCITGRRREPLEALAGSLPAGTVAVCPGDVGNPADVDAMVAATLGLGGRIDVLVNNAGTGIAPGGVVDVDLGKLQQSLNTNLMGPFLLMRAAIPHMIRGGGGSVINIASLGGLRAVPFDAAYCMTKAALIHLTRQVAVDYGRQKVRCNVVCPGPVDTPLTRGRLEPVAAAAGAEMKMDSFLAAAAAGLPLGRVAHPDELAGICTYLAGDDASFVTGAVFLVDGGTAIVDALAAGVAAAAAMPW